MADNDDDDTAGNENNTVGHIENDKWNEWNKLKLFWSFKDVFPCWLFIGNALVKLLYTFPGILLNLALVLVTIRSK
jgi:hypothetical protein